MKTAAVADNAEAKRMGAAGLKAAFAILKAWGGTPEQQCGILDLPKSTYYKYLSHPEKANLSNSQLERISYLLNIHSHLRIVFENPDNIYGFMSMKNSNGFFNGKSPLEAIGGGSFSALYETFRHVDAMRNGQW